MKCSPFREVNKLERILMIGNIKHKTFSGVKKNIMITIRYITMWQKLIDF